MTPTICNHKADSKARIWKALQCSECWSKDINTIKKEAILKIVNVLNYKIKQGDTIVDIKEVLNFIKSTYE